MTTLPKSPKASQNFIVLARVFKSMTMQKRCLLLGSYITSQINYCPLVCVIHNRKVSSKIDKIHERVLIVIDMVSIKQVSRIF